jgi:hypothetical chaperone protein
MSICGLDFGTSNSTIGVIRDGRKTMVPLEQDSHSEWQTTMPSAMFFDFEDDTTSFGRKAVALYADGKPGRLLRSMKNMLGSSYMGDGTQVKRQFYTYEEIVGFFVGRLKQLADTYLQNEGTQLESVVVGRPVYFNDRDKDLDRAAEKHLAAIARLAGFKEISFQFEPIAAAMDYEQRVTSEKLALIVDVGGGTSDFTLVKLSPERHQDTDRKDDFLAHHGVHLGGTDFDRRLSIASVMPEFGLGVPFRERPTLSMPSHFYFTLATWHEIHLLYERDVGLTLRDLRLQLSDKEPIDRLLALLKARKGHQLAAHVEQAKIELSGMQMTTIHLQELFEEYADITTSDCVLTRPQLQASLNYDIERIFGALDETLSQAGLTRRDVDTVFTTGGSTALPMIQQAIESRFADAELVAGDLYNSVGSGLLVEAIKRYS